MEKDNLTAPMEKHVFFHTLEVKTACYTELRNVLKVNGVLWKHCMTKDGKEYLVLGTLGITEKAESALA